MELKQDALLAGAMRASFDCIIVIDEAGLVVDWNPASEHTFGFSKEEAIGRSVAELIIPPEHHDAHRSGLKRYVAGGESRILNQRMRLEACRSDGSRLPVEIAVTEVDVDGQRIRVKLAELDGVIVNANPEYDDVVAAADRLHRPVKAVLAQATAAAQTARKNASAPD